MHPERMSMPITCAYGGSACQQKDVLFYVLFGMNPEYIRRLVEESVINLGRANEGRDTVLEALQLMRPQEGDSLIKLQIRFFVLLNEDETMRRRLANVKSRVMTSVCPYKAERFYDALADDLIPAWVRSRSVGHAEFVERLRGAYLCS